MAFSRAEGPGCQHEVVVNLANSGSVVLDLSESAKPRAAATLKQDRWSTTRRLGNLVARASSDDSVLELYRIEGELLPNRTQLEEGAFKQRPSEKPPTDEDREN